MFKHTSIILLCALVTCLSTTNGANILGVFPIGGTSHWQPYEAALKALAAVGHNITVITSYPQKSAVANWTDIDISSKIGVAKNSLSMDLVRTTLQKTSSNFNYITTISHRYCEIAHSFPEVKELLSGKHKFDVVFTEIFGADCDVGFAWKLNIPLISLTSSRPPPWAYYRMGNPVMPSYMHTIHVNYPEHMNFLERLYNTMFHFYFIISYNWYSNGEKTNEISQKFFGPDMPPVSEIVLNTSLIFANTHFTIDEPIPLLPNIIQIGGIHVKDEADKLPSDLQQFMDEAKHGVIYFTLGSLVRVSSLPKDTVEAFRDAFSKLPNRVLWKFELEMDDIPPNVLIQKWFPQKAIFNHQNLKLFITHGGQLGITEAIHYGIPVVIIPLFYDQYRTAQILTDKQVAVSLDFNLLTKNEILRAINTITQDEGYSRRMKDLSNRFKDRPMSSNELVVYWTEYVIRHKGAYHLRSVAADMPWYQYVLIDVILFLSLCLVSIVYMIYKIKLCLTPKKNRPEKLKTK